MGNAAASSFVSAALSGLFDPADGQGLAGQNKTGNSFACWCTATCC